MPKFSDICDEISSMLSIPDEDLTDDQRAAMAAYLDDLARQLPAGFTHDWQSESRQFTQESQSLAWAFLAALLVIYLVLAYAPGGLAEMSLVALALAACSSRTDPPVAEPAVAPATVSAPAPDPGTAVAIAPMDEAGTSPCPVPRSLSSICATASSSVSSGTGSFSQALCMPFISLSRSKASRLPSFLTTQRYFFSSSRS